MGRFERRKFRQLSGYQEESQGDPPPTEDTIDGGTFDVPFMNDGSGGPVGTLVKTAVVFWVVTRILDHLFISEKS